jgi:hypothetical protein
MRGWEKGENSMVLKEARRREECGAEISGIGWILVVAAWGVAAVMIAFIYAP